jgi:hypothetical protein
VAEVAAVVRQAASVAAVAEAAAVVRQVAAAVADKWISCFKI